MNTVVSEKAPPWVESPSQSLWKSDDGKLEISYEPYTQAVREAGGLAEMHWEEIANYKDKVPLRPRWSELWALDNERRLVCFTLRENGKLIGYSMFVLNIHLHYETLTIATNDILFVRKDKRKGRLGLRLIKESEKYLCSIGVNKITWHMKPDHDFSPLLKSLGYLHEEIIYGKVF